MTNQLYYSHHPFSQSNLKAFQDIHGICYGICLDYVRDVLKYKNNPDLKRRYNSYAQKGFTKYNNPENSNYIKRILLYQTNQYQLHKLSRFNTEISTDPNNLSIASLIKDNKPFNKRSAISIEMSGSDWAHAIAIQIIRDTNDNITGYKLLDPNYGEYDCTHGSPEENLAVLDHVFHNVIKPQYQNLEKIMMCDTELMLKELGLLNPGKGSKYNLPNQEEEYYRKEEEYYRKSYENAISDGDNTKAIKFQQKLEEIRSKTQVSNNTIKRRKRNIIKNIIKDKIVKFPKKLAKKLFQKRSKNRIGL